MVDYQTLVIALINHGHTVEHVIDTPANAGTGELVVDGRLITLEQARALLPQAPEQP